jgi:hypothetical protein
MAMDRQRPPRAWSRPWLATLAAAGLAACQGLPQLSLSDPAPPAPGWRVVERLGEARYLAPGMAGWEQVAASSMIPAGSQITTGIGGRLIVHQAANQLSASTGSRFILPGWEPGDSVRQTAGWLRYRIATAPAATFGIETPFLDLVADDAVVDVTVGDSETEVAVVRGRVRVKTLDERRQIDLHAGYTGYASLQDEPLAVRRGPGERLQAVPPLVVPALHPQRPAGARVAPDPAGAGTPAIAAFAGRAPASSVTPAPSAAQQQPVATPPAASDVTLAIAAPAAAAPVPASLPAAAMVPAGEGATPDAPRSLIAPFAPPPLAQAAFEPADVEPAPESTDPEAAEQIRQRFDGLTEGLLDGLLPALPQGPQGAGR